MKTFEISNQIKDLCARIIEVYAEDFEGIDTCDLLCLKEVSDKTPKKGRPKGKIVFADASLVPVHLWPVTDYRIVIRVYNPYDTLSDNVQKVILHHELSHFFAVPEEDWEEKGKYRIRKHDIEDFIVYNKVFGFNYHYSQNVPDILKEKININV